MKQNPLKRLFSYSWRYKWSFLISIFGFILFASADIEAVSYTHLTLPTNREV